MSCKFNSELLVAAFWTDHPKGIPPLRFWIFPRRISLPPNPFPPEDIPIPKERKFLRGQNAGLQDLFFVLNGRTLYPIMTLIRVKKMVV